MRGPESTESPRWTRAGGGTALAALLALAGASAPPAPVAATPAGAPAAHAPDGQEAATRQEAGRAGPIVSSSMTVSAERAALELELTGDVTHRIEFRDGTVSVDGESVGTYEPGGGLERSWRELLASGLRGAAGFRIDAERLRAWNPPATDGASGTAAAALTGALDRWLAPPAPAEATDETREAAGTPAAEGESAVAITGPAGERLTLAPGKLSLSRLGDRLDRLERALSRLGEDAREAARDVAFVVHDDHQIPRGQVVRGNLALLGGELRLGGQVTGDVLVLDGTLLLEPSARVDGDVLQAGGTVQRRGGRVSGEFLSVRPVGPDGADAAPDVDVEERMEDVREHARDVGRHYHDDPGFFGGIGSNIARAVGGVVGVVGLFLLLGLGGLLAVYFVRPQLEVVADTARNSFGRSFGVGLAGQFLFVPVLLVLVVAVVTILVIPFYVAAAIVAGLAGYLAVAHAAGEMLARQRYRYEWMERLRRSNSYYYVLSGLAALLLPFALAEAFHLFGDWLDFLRGIIRFIALVGTWVAGTVGFGAVLLSRGGQRTEYARSAPGSATEAGATL